MIAASPLEVLRYFHYASPTQRALALEFNATTEEAFEVVERFRRAGLIKFSLEKQGWILTAKGEGTLHASETPVDKI